MLCWFPALQWDDGDAEIRRFAAGYVLIADGFMSFVLIVPSYYDPILFLFFLLGFFSLLFPSFYFC